MVARLLMAMTMLAACCSCVPSRGGGGQHVVLAIPDPDRRLLRDLALADPLGEPAAGPALASPTSAAPPFLAALGSDDGQRAESCLTAAVYYEARSEPIDGQRAVAQVVLNRVRDRAFPASVCGVVYQRSARGCQFSFVCDGSMAQALEPRAWAIARAIADAALGGSVYAPIGAATHYHASYVSPWWAPSLDRVAAVGTHIFYRWHERLANALSFRQPYAGREAEPGVDVRRVAAAGDADLQAGVAIHRGVAEEAEAAAPLAASSPDAFGVRVHRGVADNGVSITIGDRTPAEAPAAP